MADAVDSKSTGATRVGSNPTIGNLLKSLRVITMNSQVLQAGKARPSDLLIPASHGDVLDLTGRSMWVGCESERCSPLPTSKTKINGNNVIKADFSRAQALAA